MRILFVAMARSIHTARWIGQLADRGWDLHLFPADFEPPNEQLRDITVHDWMTCRPPRGAHPTLRMRGVWPFRAGEYFLRQGIRVLNEDHRFWPGLLARTIRRVKPDLVHSLEFQHGAYLTLDARARYGGGFPPWAVSNWGSDIYFFGRLRDHAPRIRAVLSACDYYHCECRRDVQLAKEYGFQGTILPVIPCAGGMDLDHAAALRAAGPVAARRVVLVKGYQTWAGRALVALRAIRLCAPLLGDYTVAVYCPSPEVVMAAEILARDTGLAVEIIPPSSHDEILRRHGQARIYIGLSISDAISTSLLEAMTMGAFPIQSCTACADEWITPGTSGILVPPEDPEAVAEALRRALQDDDLVEQAARINERVIADRLDAETVRRQVVEMYESVQHAIPPSANMKKGN
jgi:glycosyltransferase involved in cell wall biosynthesis